MNIIDATQYGIVPETEVAQAFSRCLHTLAATPGEKALRLTPGIYYFSRENCEKARYYMTNTVEQRCYTVENDHLHHIALHLDGLSDFTLDGAGSTFVLDGQMTHIVLHQCRNICIQNCTFRSISPNLHQFTVEAVHKNDVDFRLDSESRYEKLGGRFYFVGKPYRSAFFHKRNRSFWNAHGEKDAPLRITRGAHPLRGCYRLTETAPHHFRARYWKKPFTFREGQRFCIYDVERWDAGIFINRSADITLINITQHYNHGLALIGQDSRDITVQGCRFTPDPNRELQLASLADFMQICMCAGDIRVTDCFFDGAGDDTLNVHGVHFAVKKAEGNQLTVRFMHGQCYGFNPLHEGDTIAFIRPDTLLEEGHAHITQSAMHDPFTIVLTLDTIVPGDATQYMVEDISRCPNLIFTRNRMQRIITRGMLITTRGKVVVEENEFIDCAMSAIVISDDAASWYESGCVKDIAITNNYFGRCGGPVIRIWPENRIYEGAVHQNIRIIDNRFHSPPEELCMQIKDASGIVVKGNTFSDKIPPERRLVCTRTEIQSDCGESNPLIPQ